MNRRDLLKSIGKGSAAAGAGAAAMSGTASARHGGKGSVDMPAEGATAVKWHDDAPNIPGYHYAGSMLTDDLCELGTSVCVLGGLSSAAAKLSWFGAWVTGSICSASVGACEAKDIVRKLAGGHMVKWCYVYVQENSGGPSVLVMPRL